MSTDDDRIFDLTKRIERIEEALTRIAKNPWVDNTTRKILCDYFWTAEQQAAYHAAEIAALRARLAAEDKARGRR